MKGKRVVITGGAGFIGSNLAWSFCDGNNVTIVDNLATGRIENIRPLVDSRRIQFIKGSVTDIPLMKSCMEDADYVFHEAAIPSVPRSVMDPVSANEANVTGTLATLVASRDCGVKQLVFASSSSIYGDTPTLPKREDMVPNPLSPYSLTKMVAERYCMLFTDLYGLKTVSLRYFNVYGPRQDPKSDYAAVVTRFIRDSLNEVDLTVFGDGNQTRDFTFVEDVVHANELAAAGGQSGVYNIASGASTTINDLASMVIRITGSHASVRHESSRVGDIRHSLGGILKARTEFGYEPRYTLEQGLRKTVDWHCEEREKI